MYVALCMEKGAGRTRDIVISDVSLYPKFTVMRNFSEMLNRGNGETGASSGGGEGFQESGNSREIFSFSLLV